MFREEKKTTVDSIIAQANAQTPESFPEWLAHQLCWLKSFEMGHSRELAELLLSMGTVEMTTYVKRLFAGDEGLKGDRVAAFLRQLDKRRAQFDQELAERKAGEHPERLFEGLPSDLTVIRGTATKQQKLSTVAQEYGSTQIKKLKREKAKQMAEKQREKQEQERAQRQAEALKNRRLCNCMATEHPLQGNCLRCGKIICALEGTGPCLFCAQFLAASQLGAEVRLGCAASESEELRLAIEKKNAILAQDRSRRYSHIVDDQMDHYDADDRWLSPEERAAARREKEARLRAEQEAKKRIGISLDLSSGQISTVSREELMAQAYEAGVKLRDVTCSSPAYAAAVAADFPELAAFGNSSSSSFPSSSSSSSSSSPSSSSSSTTTTTTAPPRSYKNPFLAGLAPVWQGQASASVLASEPKPSSTIVKRIQHDPEQTE